MTFFTIYYSPICGREAKFSTYVVAPNLDAAKVLIYDRNLGERIDGQADYDKPSPAIEASPAFFHWLTFLTFVAGKAGYSLLELVGDGGIIHEMVHQLNHIDSCVHDDDEGGDWDRVLRAYKNLLEDVGFGLPEKELYPSKPARAINYQI